uniref:Leucine-rich repeat-containing protein 59 n=1 Tax=Gallus gallus TaxID=9031 RepID=A0A8V1AED4_CHICK
MARGGGKSGSLKDKLDGNELDLSLCGLSEVPVRELAALPKATVLDLSCNSLVSLPSDFCSLTHLVKLDLSKNRLQQLPVDFGRLVSLQHLDLLNNRLVTLPVSFAQLKPPLHHPFLQNLKWLDLKDNPLDPVLAKVAGDCLDEKQCKQAAVRVLQHMKVIQSEQDRERQRKLQAEREMEKKREAEQRAREAQERELRKREKAEEKERRRREYDAQRAAKQEMEKKTKKETVQSRKLASSSRPPQPARHKHSWSRSVLRALLLVLLCILCTLAVCKLTELQHQPLCVSVNTLYEDVVAAVQNHKTLQNMLQQNSQQ